MYIFKLHSLLTIAALAAFLATGPQVQAADNTNPVALIAQIEQNMVAIPKKNFAMGKYEITQAEWAAIMGNNPSRFKRCGDNCPVEQVSWNDVQVFLQKLNDKTGKQYRLPTEDEWEYACYSGQGNTDYCGGNNIGLVAWYTVNSNGSTHPVGQKRANAFGLYDMSGNVLEWMQTEHDGRRVLRGGSWFNLPDSSYAATSGLSNPAFSDDFIGFRIARSLP